MLSIELGLSVFTAIDGGVPVDLATLNDPAAGVIAIIVVVEL